MKKNRLLAQEITVLLINACIGSGLITLPHSLAKAAGPDGLWALCGVLVISTPCIIMFVALIRQFPNESITKINCKLLGKHLGFISNCLLILYLLYITSMVLRTFSSVVSVIILRQTPIEIIMGSMLIACCLLAKNGIVPVARACQIIAFLVIPFLFLIPLQVPVFDFGEFLPILYSSKESFLTAMRVSIFSVTGFELVLFFGGNLDEKKKLLPASLTGLFFVGLISIVIVIMTFGTLSVNQTALLSYPVIEMIKYLPVPLLILERIELFFFTIWIAYAYSTLVILLNVNAQHISDMLQKDYCKYIVWLLAIFSFFLARIPQNLIEVDQYTNYASYMWLALVFVIVPLLLIVAKIKQPKLAKKKKNPKSKRKKH